MGLSIIFRSFLLVDISKIFLSLKLLIDLGYGDYTEWNISNLPTHIYELMIPVSIISRLLYIFSRSGMETGYSYGNLLMEIQGLQNSMKEDLTWQRNSWLKREWDEKDLDIVENLIEWLYLNKKVLANLIVSQKIFVKRVKVS